MKKASKSKILNIADVAQLGRVLIEASNLYPTTFLTERDFFPLVFTFLKGRLPSVIAEVASKDGVIDFQLKGNNSTWLELAVQPRNITDPNQKHVLFPGHNTKNSLYASQNRPELKKLSSALTGRTRFLLLIDLIGSYDTKKLKNAYEIEGKKIEKGKAVRVVFSSQDISNDTHFLVKSGG